MLAKKKEPMNVLNMLDKKRSIQVQQLTTLERFLLATTLGGISFLSWDLPLIKREVRSLIPDSPLGEYRKICSDIVVKLSGRVIKYLEKEFKGNRMLHTRTKLEVPVRQYTLFNQVNVRMKNLKENVPYYVSMETDDWKSNKRTNYSSIIFNLTTAFNKKASLIANYSQTEGKTREDHKNYLIKVCQQYNAESFWVNTCTDNASAVLHCTSDLTGNINYPAYAGHIGCLSHILNLICETVVNCLSVTPDTSDLVETEDDQELDSKLEISYLLNDPLSGNPLRFYQS